MSVRMKKMWGKKRQSIKKGQTHDSSLLISPKYALIIRSILILTH